MSLTKLFSGKYAFQNIKKSRGILAIMLIAMPIITLFFLYNYDNSLSTPYNMNVLIGANLIGMFIIPFIVSNVLLGYVYQRNSIDFVNSMPISRKKIYLTNMLVGVIYLIILQFVNFLIASLYVLIIKDSSFSISMMSDAFCVMSCGYIFLFIISSLALTVSGNKFTQIIVAAIILFLIPFIRIVNFSDLENQPISLINNDGTQETFIEGRNPIYCVPMDTIIRVFGESSVYNLSSIIVTIFLGIIYILIGTKLFEKRKMENTGASFKSEKIHLIIKAITLYPMIVFLSEIYDDIRFPELVLILFLIFVYYFVYDLITNKKIKLKVTILSFILCCAVLVVINSGLNFVNGKLPKNNEFYAKDIENIELELSDAFYSYLSTNYDANYAKIENEEIKNFIFDNIIPVNENFVETYVYDINTNFSSTNKISLKITLNNGRKIKFDAELYTNSYIELLEKILQDENYIKNLSEKCKIKSNAILEYNAIGRNRFLLKKEDKIIELTNANLIDYIKQSIQNEIDIHKSTTYDETGYIDEIRIYSYTNHSRNVLEINLTSIPVDMLNVVAEGTNNYSKKIIERLNEEYVNPYFEFEKICNQEIIYSGNLSEENYKKVLDYIKEDENNNFDSTKDYYIIDTDIGGIRYFTNDIEKIEEIIENSRLTREEYDVFDDNYSDTVTNTTLENQTTSTEYEESF